MVYFYIPQRYRWILLLISSYYFYMCWKAEYAILIIISTMIDYIAGIRMAKKETRRERTKYLIMSLCSNLGLLFLFKYFNFFNNSLHTVLSDFNIFYALPEFKLLLPVGISFYTFQTLSYTIDVYRGIKKPEKHLGIFAVYVAFFPQLVAGPIERSTHLLPQFFKKMEFDYHRVTDGLKLMAWGFFKKIVIADNLALYVNHIYNHPQDNFGWSLIFATYFFAFQIYCDFSGYSDIAIGSAQVMGYDIMDNFRQPYYAKSISEFWKRWHISLSTWFRDYFYIPLGGNRVSKLRWYFNLMATFVVSGLWHGANWTFVIWGALHGTYLIVSIISRKIRDKFNAFVSLSKNETVHKFVKIFVVFQLVNFAWIFFRANSLSDAFLIIKNMTKFGSIGLLQSLNAPNFRWETAVLTIFVMEIVHFLQRHSSVRELIAKQPLLVRWTIYYLGVMSILLLGRFQEQAFIYFQF